MKTANPYLYFNGNTEEAFNFYKTVFGVELTQILRFGDIEGNPMNVSDSDRHKIAHIGMPLGNVFLMGTDVIDSMDESLTVGTNFYITLEPESAEEAETVFHGLSEGGTIHIPLKKEFWAEKYGMCTDKFGVQWMVSYTGEAGL
ncbi:MAG: VOC family protein [Balneolales bacterium]